MSLQASVRYYEAGGHVRERSESPKPKLKNGFGIKPIPVPFHRPNPIKVAIEHPTQRIGIFPDPMKPKLMRHGGMSVNEMRNMVMGSHQPFSNQIGSIHFENGGKVPDTPPAKTVLAEIPTSGVDKVPALLQSGEIVIPKKYAKKVNGMLKKEGIHLPGC
jgi:hypothetical protein